MVFARGGPLSLFSWALSRAETTNDCTAGAKVSASMTRGVELQIVDGAFL